MAQELQLQFGTVFAEGKNPYVYMCTSDEFGTDYAVPKVLKLFGTVFAVKQKPCAYVYGTGIAR